MFHFKKFSIDDGRAAMKIGTDAVLLGAWAPCIRERRILDIGTGSGILALMMAQRNENIPVDAVEMESDAAALAEQNFILSPWQSKLNIYHTPIQEFAAQTIKKYTLVICNPPFFTDSLKSPGEKRNLARHNDVLPAGILLRITSQLISSDGKAAFIIPADDFQSWIKQAAEFSLFPQRITSVKSSSGHKPHRVLISLASAKLADAFEDELVIYESANKYSHEYMELTKDFYLHF